MDIKGIFVRIWDVVSHPGNAWKTIAQEGLTLHEIQRGFFFPLMLCLLVAETLHLFFDASEWDSASSFFAYYLKGNFVVFASCFAGFYLAFLLSMLLMKNDRLAGIRPDSLATYKLALYSSSALWCIKLLTMLVPLLFFLNLLTVYVAYILWEGIPVMLPKVKEEKMGLLTVVLSLLLIGCPWVVEKILLKLMY